LELLQYMADQRNIDSNDKDKEQLVNELASHVHSLGLTVVFRILKVKDLKVLSDICKIDDDKLGKATLAKKIQEVMEEKTPEVLLEKASLEHEDLLDNIIKAMEMGEMKAPRKEKIQTILQVANEMGLENFLSSFPTTKIKEFVKHCGLKVDSDSLDTLLRALVDQESIKHFYPGTADEPLSKITPPIDENITAVQLFNHYFREDLVKFCEKHKLTSHGSKKELVDRIRRYFDGHLEEKDKKKERKKKASKSKDSKDSKDNSDKDSGDSPLKHKKRVHEEEKEEKKSSKPYE